MTNTTDITSQSIRSLETEAFAVGDALQGYLCRVALGVEYTAAELADESCLSPTEQTELLGYTRTTAREACVAAIQAAQAMAD